MSLHVSGAASAKVSKQSVRYRPGRRDSRHCGNCVMFHGAGIGTCELVRGLIQSGMVCNRWVKG